MDVTIALDAMGGDRGPCVIVPAALKVIAENPQMRLILVGDETVLNQELRARGAAPSERLVIRHASQKVTMDDLPSVALRTKKDSSMRVAIDLVKSNEAGACVSAGNTGALLATARFVLKTLPGIDRPAIITALPTMRGHSYVLDLGANIDSTAENLFQFAVMGSILASAVDGIQNPTIGLLNIGEEEIKGNEVVKAAAQLLSASEFNYKGFVEGDDIYKGKVDVVVCDGFVGNVALKSSEGVVRMMAHFLREEFTRTPVRKLIGFLAKPILCAFRNRVDPSRYNGASLVGLRGIVVKSHGGADEQSFINAINVAKLEVAKNVPERISKQLETLLVERRAV